MSHRQYFEVEVREPYMGNVLPLKIEVRLVKGEKETYINVIVVSPEGIRNLAKPISPEVFNE